MFQLWLLSCLAATDSLVWVKPVNCCIADFWVGVYDGIVQKEILDKQANRFASKSIAPTAIADDQRYRLMSLAAIRGRRDVTNAG